MKIKVYTDGACSGNPGPGGWAMVFNVEDGCQHFSGNELDTTNNRMELMAVCECLKKILRDEKSLELSGNKKIGNVYEIYSDSAYVVNSINNNWLAGWKSLSWKTKQGEDVKNKDIWMQIEQALRHAEVLGYNVYIIKIKGHAGNTFNELVDNLAKQESAKAKMRK